MPPGLFARRYDEVVAISNAWDLTLEHAELKRDQIHAYGRDRLLARSSGSMTSFIEPAV